MRKLRVLTIGHSYTIAINRSLIREVASATDFSVTVAAPKFFHGDLRNITLDPEPEDSRLETVGVDVRFSRFVHVFRYNRQTLKELLNGRRYDVVHAWEEPYIYAGYQIARCLEGSDARFCFRTAQNYSKQYPPPFSYFERATLARAQGWIAGATLVHRAMLERGYPAEKGHILSLAVDLGTFKPQDESTRAAVRRELEFEGPIIGFVGRLTAAKGLDLLMGAVEKMRPTTRWNLMLMGSGPYETKVRSWAAQKGWADRVRIVLVPHHDVPRFLGAVDILVAPSQTTPTWKEQFGRMLIEAFACGVPVIGSDSGEIPYVIGDAGLIVKEDDPNAWAQTIDGLLADPTARRELAKKGLARVQRFSTSSVAAKYRDYYRWLAEQHCS